MMENTDTIATVASELPFTNGANGVREPGLRSRLILQLFLVSKHSLETSPPPVGCGTEVVGVYCAEVVGVR